MNVVNARKLYIENNSIKIVNICSKIFHFNEIGDTEKYNSIVSVGMSLGLDLKDYFNDKTYNLAELNCRIIDDKEAAEEAIEEGLNINSKDIEKYGYDFIYDYDLDEAYSSEEYYSDYIQVCFDVEDWPSFDFQDYVDAINSQLEKNRKIVANFYKKKEKLLEKYGQKENIFHQIGNQIFQLVLWEGFSFHLKIDEKKIDQKLGNVKIFKPESFMERFSKKSEDEKKEIWLEAEKLVERTISPSFLEICIEGRKCLVFWIKEQKGNQERLAESEYYNEHFA